VDLRKRTRDPSQHIRQIKKSIQRAAENGKECHESELRVDAMYYLPFFHELKKEGVEVTLFKGDMAVRFYWTLEPYCEICGKSAPPTSNFPKLCSACRALAT